MTALPVRHDALPGWPAPGDFIVEGARAARGFAVLCPQPGCQWRSEINGHNLHLKDLYGRAQQHIDDETEST